jgi:hypothetical protein
MALVDCYEKIKKAENEFTAAYLNIELQRCKLDGMRSTELADVFHKSTQAWIQARQNLSKIGDRLPEGTLTKEEFDDIFLSTSAEKSQPNSPRKIPLDDLRYVREKVYVLRKILEGKVVTKLNSM